MLTKEIFVINKRTWLQYFSGYTIYNTAILFLLFSFGELPNLTKVDYLYYLFFYYVFIVPFGYLSLQKKLKAMSIDIKSFVYNDKKQQMYINALIIVSLFFGVLFISSILPFAVLGVMSTSFLLLATLSGLFLHFNLLLLTAFLVSGKQFELAFFGNVLAFVVLFLRFYQETIFIGASILVYIVFTILVYQKIAKEDEEMIMEAILEKNDFLTFENLQITYKQEEQPILAHGNLELPKKGLWLLTGGNGAGKSTMLHFLYEGKIEQANVTYDSFVDPFKNKILLKDSQSIPVDYFEQDIFQLIARTNGLESGDYQPIHPKRKMSTYSTGELKMATLHMLSYLSFDLVLLDEYLANLTKENLMPVMESLRDLATDSLVIVSSNEEFVMSQFEQQLEIRDAGIHQTSRTR